jgi:hypothetical protein
MTKVYFILALVITVILNACNTKKQEIKVRDTISIYKPYLGQTPPGSVPEPFAPGMVVTDGWEYGGTFSPDMKEFYYLRESKDTAQHDFVLYKYRDGQWQETVVSPRRGQPYVAPDGKTIYLGRRFMERSADGLSEVKSLGTPFEEMLIMRLTASANGTYVFDEIGSEDGDGLIRYSEIKDGVRQAPKAFGPQVNTGIFNAHPFIAPDESYLIWDGDRPGGYGDSDIYISFKQKDGTWGEAINLGDQINTSAWEAAATVTPDGKYLFFNRNVGSDSYANVDIFWVDAQFIEDLRSE